MMECYGDAASGPTPEQCEYGSVGLIQGTNGGISQRNGPLCVPGAVPSPDHPALGLDGSTASGCDTQEPSDPTHVGPCPGPFCDSTTFRIPFAPVSDPTQLDYASGDITYFSEFDTNEVQEAVTATDGTGERQFETLTGTQAPGLGCGQAEANGQPRGCWLVIVPRGQCEPNGNPVNLNSTSSFLDTSPL